VSRQLIAPPRLIDVFIAQCQRDLRLAWRHRGNAMQPILFATMVVALFTLAVGSEPKQLSVIAPGIIWVAVLLAGLVNLDSLYRSDYEDGSLEQMLLASAPLSIFIAARIFTHWLTSTLPLLIVVPLLSQMLFLPNTLMLPLMLTLALGTPTLSLVGAIIAALTVGVRHSGMLLALLALPLYVPILVFGAGATMAASQGFSWLPAVWILAAGFILSLVLAPITAAAALKISLT
jgi:heme exporter protein B